MEMHGAPAPTSLNNVLYSGFSHRGFAAAAGRNGRSGSSAPRLLRVLEGGMIETSTINISILVCQG
ncbi:hypothetical protein HanXRQr2_Chr12g0550651 [Helianthus annuus]|uniref:Uncharacterized protein n=1 Tax=Helianthus annuus TaxID=4232 RepID=A0A251T4G4_HELAN|nr:hypothetical protein HanXRQr2_Chr12g0550651 [Helianthus annuus]KAJ0490070.1 hypothetical protein HanHA300_Chr12g0451221 [Helianthus annuus]KAJ0505982.1 hypothetical protein HanHA89_Chr12g0476721 [Helianthus annuus]KAJ0675653.1 hypothetical protein HanLR1_Chr12g0453621 [Helianthus annuus]KAJ0863452.1 hypothetical protein HanPSC8_Chr12g0530171 [Helianthus annuus]